MKKTTDKARSRMAAIAAGAAFVLVCSGAQAATQTFVTANNWAEATVTTGSGLLTVTLQDLIANPTSSSQALSDFEFVLSNSTSTTGTFTQSGSLINIANHTGTPVGGNPTHWGFSGTSFGSGTSFTFTALTGGQPSNMIIGPGPYTNANTGVSNFNPYINMAGTFTLAASGITPATLVDAAVFSFGTGPDTFVPGELSAIPLPGALPLFATGLAGLGLLGWRRKRNGQKA